MRWMGKELSCERCGSPDHITGIGACPAWGKWWPQCCYCNKKGVDVREHGAYYGCHKCIDEYYPPKIIIMESTKTNSEKQNVLRKLPTTSDSRKNLPIATGVIDYFPLALGAVAELSKKANDQHNPGMPLHWARGKSKDHADCLMRHFIERGTVDTDGIRHTAKVAWRALAMLQEEIEKEAGWEPK